jgi:hypothetical protein
MCVAFIKWTVSFTGIDAEREIPIISYFNQQALDLNEPGLVGSPIRSGTTIGDDFIPKHWQGRLSHQITAV